MNQSSNQGSKNPHRVNTASAAAAYAPQAVDADVQDFLKHDLPSYEEKEATAEDNNSKKSDEDTAQKTPAQNDKDLNEAKKYLLEKNAELSNQIEELKKERNTFKEDYVRAHAEMENVRRRAQKDITQKTNFAVSNFAKSLLPVADNLSRALSSVPSTEEAEDKYDSHVKNLIIGIEMTEKEMHNVFEQHNIKKIDSIGKKFDPNYHQVVQEIEHDSAPGTIVQELQVGYTINDRLLREAVVVVSKGPSANKPE